jgi:hypothetical protein
MAAALVFAALTTGDPLDSDARVLSASRAALLR